MLASLALHALVLALPVQPPAFPRLELPEIQDAVELGLETPVQGAATPPSQPAPPSLEEPASPPPAETPRAAEPPPPPPPPPPEEPPQLPDPTVRLTPPSILLVPDAAAPEDVDEAAVAEADAGGDAGDESAVATADDAGDAGDDADDAVAVASVDAGDDGALALADAGAEADAATGVPSLASAAGGLAAAVPAGSVVTLLLRMDRVRVNPNGPRVAAMLQSIRDWRVVLDGTEIDPVRDFDAILLASANPFGTRERPPDVMALVRTHAPRGFLRASVEQMAGARAPSLPPPPPDPTRDAGTAPTGLREHFARVDAGVLPPPTSRVWRRQGGAEVATIDRYLGPHEVVLLGEDLAAIAPRERVPQLLAVLGARGQSPVARMRATGGRLVAMLQAEGIRNLLRLPGRATMVPTRGDVVILERRDGNAPDGGVDLLVVAQYETDEQAARVVPLATAFVADVTDSVDATSRTLQGRLAAASGAVHFDRIRSALGSVRVRADGATVRVEAALSADEVAELLEVQRLVQLFQ